MWAAIIAISGELIKFLCKWGTEWLDGNKERRKARKEIMENDIKKAKTQRDRILAISRYNRV